MLLTPLALARLANPHYQITPHLQMLERFVLEILATPGQARGIIQLPIRHGKSEAISKVLPAWHQMIYPDRQVILTGYGNEFSAEWGRQARDLFDRMAPRLFGLRLNKKVAAGNHWSVDRHGGSMRTCGTFGSITGKTADLLISDDQIRSQEDANSPLMRDKIYRWFRSDALTRLTPNGKCIVVLSRRHPDDLVGRLMNEGGWRTLRLPALCDDPENDPLFRSFNAPLWANQWSLSQLLKVKEELELNGQSHIWQCLYQQNPMGDPGSCEFPADYFDGIWCGSTPTDGVKLRVLALDPSKGRRSRLGDYQAFTFITLTNDLHLYVQSWLWRIPLDQLITQAAALIEQLRPDGFVYESIGFQELLGMNIAKACQARGVIPTIHRYEEHENKQVRIRTALAPLLGQRRIHLDESSPGNRLLLAQLREFPTGAHDDGPDSLTMGIDLLNYLLYGTRQPEPVILRC